MLNSFFLINYKTKEQDHKKVYTVAGTSFVCEEIFSRKEGDNQQFITLVPKVL